MGPERFARELETLLLTRGLPLSYVRRAVAELSDHQQDLWEDFLAAGCSPQEAEQRASETMGNVDCLSGELHAALRNSSFLGRHPAWSFLLFPLLAFVFSLLLSALMVVLVGSLLEWRGLMAAQEPLRSLLLSAFDLLPVLISLIPAVIFCVLNRKSYCDIRWAGYACLLLGILGYALVMQLGLNPPEIGRHTNTLSIGFGLGTPHDWQAPLRFCLPLAAFLGYWGISRLLRLGNFPGVE